MAKTSSKKALAQVRAALAANDYERAKNLTSDVLGEDPSNYNANVFLGVASVALQDSVTALESYQRAIDLRPDLPLAYKGIVQTLTKPFSPKDPLRLARAHVRLAETAPDQASPSLLTAATTFVSLALEDRTILQEALAAIQTALSHPSIPSHSPARDELEYSVCLLLSQDLPPPSKSQPSPRDSRYIALNSAPISEALDALTAVLVRNNDSKFREGGSDLVIERLLTSGLYNKELDRSLSVLRTLSAHDALLHISETDHGPAVASDHRRLLAKQSISQHPDDSSLSRAKIIMIADAYAISNDHDLAKSELTSSSKTPYSAKTLPKVPVFQSCTHSFVSAFIHFQAAEYKPCIAACKVGIGLAVPAGFYTRLCNVLTILSAGALNAEARYSEAWKAFDRVRSYARKHHDSWLLTASMRGLINSAISAHGRKARATALAIEEAAAASTGPEGLLESVWSDAIIGDIDIERMSELVQRAVKETEEPVNIDDLPWEYAVLDSTFCRSPVETAAVSLTRLGQMTVRAGGYTPASLKSAQAHYMQAAGLMKQLSDPFAHLGFIFEQFARQGGGDKMNIRAIRCYERALDIDAAHPVASRRLSRILSVRGLHDEAAEVARRAADRDPKARWAFNVLGWRRLTRGRFVEAATAFQAALRGKPGRTTRQEESLYGTDVGCTLDDNDTIVDVDSWRGLSFAYRAQGKTGASCSCLDDALSVLEASSNVPCEGDAEETCPLKDMWRAIVESERNVALLSSQKSLLGNLAEKSDQSSGFGQLILTVGYSASDAQMLMASREWLLGNYRRSSYLRQDAARNLENWMKACRGRNVEFYFAPILKRIGDIWMEAAGEVPEDIAQLISRDFVDESIRKAMHAYSRACLWSTSNKQLYVQDMAGALLRYAVHCKDEEAAKIALQQLVFWEAESPLVASAFLTFAEMSKSAEVKHEAREVAEQVIAETKSRGHRISLSASMAMCANTSEEVDDYAEAAIIATRGDPTDWRAWYAVGKVREVDAERNGWDESRVKSCEQAYGESERLGGGPAAIKGLLRCITRRISGKRPATPPRALYTEACFAMALAKIVNAKKPSGCQEVINSFTAQREKEVAEERDKLSQIDDETATLSHLHLYPHIPHVASLFKGSPS